MQTELLKICKYPEGNVKHLNTRYEQALQLSNVGFWEFNPANNTIWFSNNILHFIGLSEDNNTIDFGYLQKIVSPDERYKFDFLTEQTFSTEDKVEFDLKISIDTVPAKTHRILHFIINPVVQSAPGNNSYFGVIIDITDKKKHEDELLKVINKAEESDKLKSVFLTNMSHEIRTPMNAILGFTELLNIGDLSPEKKKEFLSIIKNKSKNLLALIDDIIELAKFEAGELSINKSETNLIKIFTELHTEFIKEKIRLHKEHIDIYLSILPEQKYSTIYSDPGRIQQVLTYLLDNALKYTEKGYIQFGYEVKDNKHLHFFVKDTGIGIAKEYQKFIFNRFKYRDDNLSKGLNTSGLSLTISKSIIELLGGKIHVESAVGQGSTFSFTLPVGKVDKSLGEDEILDDSLLNYNWKNKVILVAEDEEVNFRFIEAVLASTQVQLLHVNNGQQAIELCKNIGKIDLILMDIRMPEVNGYDAIKEIKKIRKDLPIIVQTAYTFKEEKFRCQDAGCDDYISKPINIEELIKKINKFFTE